MLPLPVVRPMLGAQDFSAGRDLYRATLAVTRDLGFLPCYLKKYTSCRLLRQASGTEDLFYNRDPLGDYKYS
jgi:hypothetical protein